MLCEQNSKQKKNIKTKEWGFTKESKKADAQNVLDSVLAFAYREQYSLSPYWYKETLSHKSDFIGTPQSVRYFHEYKESYH